MKRLLFALLVTVACVSNVGAQRAMKVWNNGKFELFKTVDVDSVQFVTLVTDIYLSHTELEMSEGEKKQLVASVYPVDADEHDVAWRSSSPDVASVDAQGMVTANAGGTAVITATAQDGSGVKASCTVTVSAYGVDAGGLTITTGEAEATDYIDFRLNAHIDGLEKLENGSYSVFFYYSKTNSEPDVKSGTRLSATVGANGDVVASLTGLAMPSTCYYRVAVVTFAGEVYYGKVRTITVEDAVSTEDEIYMGSCISIARCDLGASSPEETGSSFAWGETVSKTSFWQSNYAYYNSMLDIYQDIADDISGTKYDAATAMLGEGWHIPARWEWQSLTTACTWKFVKYKDVSGYLVISKSVPGNVAFVPSSNHWLSAKYDVSEAYCFTGTYEESIAKYNGYKIRAVKFDMKPGEAVDLGLSVKWATCNVGAETPEDYGWYLAWGETKPKKTYGWSTYKWCNGSKEKMTKYSQSTSYWDSSLGTSPDQKTVLDPEDDAAHVNWGGNWRMPTDAELTELRSKCTWTWTSQNGVYGMKVTGPNGNSIFLPAAGYRGGGSRYDAGSLGYYWSSSLSESSSSYARSVDFGSGGVGRSYDYRYGGRSVRPVRSE